MAIVWGPTRNNCRIGLEYAPLPAVNSSTTAVTVSLRVYFASTVSMYDYTNSASWNGGLGTGSDTNDTLTGPNSAKLLRTISKSVPLIYGETQNITQWYRQSNIEYTGDLTAQASITVPARPYTAPDPVSSVSVSRASDTSHNLAWTNNPASGKPYEKVFVQRSTDDGGYVTVATLSGSTTSWTDGSTAANRRYRWRITPWNNGGYGSYVYTPVGSVARTTPSAPSIGSATKNSDGSISISWVSNSPSHTSFEVWDYPNGTSTGTLVGSAGLGSSGYTHASPNTSQTHQYKVRAVAANPAGIPTLYSAYSLATNTVQLIAPPNAPVNLSPASGAQAANETVKLSWLHNPVDTTAQTSYVMRYRVSYDGGSTWGGGWIQTSRTYTANQYHNFSGGWSAGALVEWQVQTWGAHATSSPFSNVASFQVNERPSVTITTPGSLVQSANFTPMWVTSSSGGAPQGGATVTLYDGAGATVLKSWTLNGDTTGMIIPGILEDGESYTVGIIANSGGLASQEARRAFNVVYARPAVPTIVVDYIEETAEARIAITNPAGTPEVVTNEVYANGELIGSVPPGGTFSDPIPDFRGTTYTVRAITALPSFAESAPHELEFPESGVGVHFNGGEGFSTHAAMWAGNPQFTDDFASDVVIERFDGDKKHGATWGPGEVFTTAVAGMVFFNEQASSIEDWRALAQSRSTVCLRRRDGRWFGAVSDLAISHSTNLWGQVSIKFTETGADDDDLLRGLPY